MIIFFTLIASALITLASGQLYFHHPSAPIPYAYQAQPQTLKVVRAPEHIPLAHRSVVENAYKEQMLPPHLLKSNKFYNNPAIAEGLAKESWFTEHEMPVFDREAEKIPREMVYKIFKNAGWIKRR